MVGGQHIRSARELRRDEAPDNCTNAAEFAHDEEQHAPGGIEVALLELVCDFALEPEPVVLGDSYCEKNSGTPVMRSCTWSEYGLKLSSAAMTSAAKL